MDGPIRNYWANSSELIITYVPSIFWRSIYILTSEIFEYSCIFLKMDYIAKNECFIKCVENVTTKQVIMLFHIMSFPYYVMYEASTLLHK